MSDHTRELARWTRTTSWGMTKFSCWSDGFELHGASALGRLAVGLPAMGPSTWLLRSLTRPGRIVTARLTTRKDDRIPVLNQDNKEPEYGDVDKERLAVSIWDIDQTMVFGREKKRISALRMRGEAANLASSFPLQEQGLLRSLRAR